MKARERKLQYTLLALLLGVCQLAASTDFEAASVESRWKAGDAGVVLTLEFPAPTSGPDAWPDLASGMELAAPPLLNRLVRIPDRSGVSVRILQQDWRSRPTSHGPRRGLRPRVAARSVWARVEALQRNRAFIDAYRTARAAWLAGLEAVFPPGTYWLRRFASVVVAEPSRA